MFHVPEDIRITDHPILESDASFGNNGAFKILQSNGRDLYIIASSESEDVQWEHVSVHVYDGKRCLIPRWDEMCKIKDLFWDEEDVVVQYHPKKSEYINCHEYTLHLWRPVGFELPYPPVGNMN